MESIDTKRTTEPSHKRARTDDGGESETSNRGFNPVTPRFRSNDPDTNPTWEPMKVNGIEYRSRHEVKMYILTLLVGWKSEYESPQCKVEVMSDGKRKCDFFLPEQRTYVEYKLGWPAYIKETNTYFDMAALFHQKAMSEGLPPIRFAVVYGEFENPLCFDTATGKHCDKDYRHTHGLRALFIDQQGESQEGFYLMHYPNKGFEWTRIRTKQDWEWLMKNRQSVAKVDALFKELQKIYDVLREDDKLSVATSDMYDHRLEVDEDSVGGEMKRVKVIRRNLPASPDDPQQSVKLSPGAEFALVTMGVLLPDNISKTEMDDWNAMFRELDRGGERSHRACLVAFNVLWTRATNTDEFTAMHSAVQKMKCRGKHHVVCGQLEYANHIRVPQASDFFFKLARLFEDHAETISTDDTMAFHRRSMLCNQLSLHISGGDANFDAACGPNAAFARVLSKFLEKFGCKQCTRRQTTSEVKSVISYYTEKMITISVSRPQNGHYASYRVNVSKEQTARDSEQCARCAANSPKGKTTHIMTKTAISFKSS